MKRKIQQAFEHQTPNVLQSVLSECENEKGEIVVKKENWQSVTPKKPKRFSWTAVAGIAAMIAVLVGIGFTVMKGASKPAPESQMPYAEGDQTESTESVELITKETEIVEPTEPEIEWDIPSLVAQYNIAPAKAELVLRALEYHPEYTAEELSKTEIDELLQLNLNQSTEHYAVGLVDAQRTAMAHFGISGMWNFECEAKDGIYTMRFCYENFSYSCRISGGTGEILSSDRTENPDAEEQIAAVKATLAFMEDFTPITFLGEDRDLTPYLVDADAEIWANALYFLPKVYARYFYNEFWLTNQYDYILQYAKYWQTLRKNSIGIENLQTEYSISDVEVWGDFVRVCLSEEKAFNYAGESTRSYLENSFEIMLVNEDDAWKIFDIAEHEGNPVKYPDGLPEPPLVTEAYSDSYVWRGGTTCNLSLPQIMINGDYAQQLNEKFYGWIDNLRARNLGENSEALAYEYEWNVHGDLLTIHIHETNSSFHPGYFDYYYVLRISDGGKATREEILAAAGVDPEELIERAHPLIAHTFGTSFMDGESLQSYIDMMPSIGTQGMGAFMQYSFGRSVSRENIEEAVLYLDKDGTLCFQAKIYQIAGADYHEREYRIDDAVQKSPFYETLMTYSIAWEIPIDNGYPFEEVFLKAFETAGVSESEVADLQGFVTYYVTRDSYYRITFSVQGEPHTYYISVGTLEILDEMGG